MTPETQKAAMELFTAVEAHESTYAAKNDAETLAVAARFVAEILPLGPTAIFPMYRDKFDPEADCVLASAAGIYAIDCAMSRLPHAESDGEWLATLVKQNFETVKVACIIDTSSHADILSYRYAGKINSYAGLKAAEDIGETMGTAALDRVCGKIVRELVENNIIIMAQNSKIALARYIDEETGA
jgi:hypothetical protein